MDQNFRFAFNGFNRSDVVNYLEFLNMKHSEQVNQLTLDNEMLRQQLNARQNSAVSSSELEELRARLDAVTQERDALMGRVVSLEGKLSAQPEGLAPVAVAAPVTAAEPAATNLYGPMQELEAYRRAERAEREAKERAQKIRSSAEEFVQLAITKAQSAAETYDDAARQANARLNALLTSVDDGRQAMLSAVEQLRKINMD